MRFKYFEEYAGLSNYPHQFEVYLSCLMTILLVISEGPTVFVGKVPNHSTYDIGYQKNTYKEWFW